MQELQTEALRLAAIIEAPTGLGFLPTFGFSPLEDAQFVLHDAQGYHLCYRERGQVSTETFATADDLLFDVFQGVTQSMADHATRFERRADVDDRRRWFPVQAELMRRLSPRWGERHQAHQDDVLRRYPFHDDPPPN